MINVGFHITMRRKIVKDSKKEKKKKKVIPFFKWRRDFEIWGEKCINL